MCRYVINGETSAVNPEGKGTKVAAHYILQVPAGKKSVIGLRLSSEPIDGRS